uniref:G_PROTEIN_RECEP_F1_2 domain-containing protein n=2 Tax=Caenorhabditis tropicalis TaxID=1561998 RepID=A0A1I7V2S9_9PELO
MPMAMEDEPYEEFRRVFGPILTINCTFFYEHPLYLTLLMIIQRIYAVFQPFNRHFTTGKLWIYCGIMTLFSWISLLIPFFSDCPVNINQRTYSFAVACKERHPVS